MQASQSNNASDLSTSEMKPDSTFTRNSSSPFSAPLQAARKYFERQRGDAWQAGVRQTEAARRDPLQAVDETSAGNRSQSIREEGSREQDRRLERSLYEGHAIEAGLGLEDTHFEGTYGRDASSPTRSGRPSGLASERACIDESDGSEPLFPYALSGPSPDPEVVRGAIFRLARDSEGRRRETFGSSAYSASTDSVRAAERPRADTGAGETAFRATGNAEERPTTTEPAQPLNFADVARRLWEADAVLSGAGSRAELAPGAALDAMETATAMESETRELRAGIDREFAFIQDASAADGAGLQSSERGEIPLQPGLVQVASQKESETSGMDGVTVLQKAAADAVCHAQGEPALAHDACNLLSALALYSELLGSPGVLEEQYRHYADELKLMAGRSQVLIDRLLRVAARREGLGAVPNGQPMGASEAVGASSEKTDGVPAILGSAVSIDAVTTGTVRSVDASLAIPAVLPLVSRFLATRILVSGTHIDAVPDGTTRPEVSDRANQKAAVPSAPGPSAPAPLVVIGMTEETNLVGLLMRWGTLLSTLAHGTLEVVFGPHAAAPVPAGAEALERILVNLVRNARAATVAGGAIRIGVGMADAGSQVDQTDGDQEISAGKTSTASGDGLRGRNPGRTIVLTVDDSGCGMTEVQIQRVLCSDAKTDCSDAKTEETRTPLYVPATQTFSDGYGRWPGNGRYQREAVPEAGSRVAETLGDERRRGLGLQIVRELVTESGGTLSIQSWPGRGTRIEIRWQVATLASVVTPVGEAQAHPVEEAAEGVLAVLHAVPPAVAETSAQTALSEETKDAAGPDGFSEVELRAMMLRLHRASPQERSPLSKRLGHRPALMREGDRGLGVVGSGVAGPNASGSFAKSAQRTNSAARDAEPKGAIAC